MGVVRRGKDRLVGHSPRSLQGKVMSAGYDGLLCVDRVRIPRGFVEDGIGIHESVCIRRRDRLHAINSEVCDRQRCEKQSREKTSDHDKKRKKKREGGGLRTPSALTEVRMNCQLFQAP